MCQEEIIHTPCRVSIECSISNRINKKKTNFVITRCIFNLPTSNLVPRMARVISNTPLLFRMVNETFSIVTAAQSIIRKVMQSGEFSVVDKGTDDLQTKADRAAQNYITSKLSTLFPKATIIGEEGDNVVESYDALLESSDAGARDNDSNLPINAEFLSKPLSIPQHINSLMEEDLVVWIDPLDGTAEFAKGITEGVTVLVGFASGGQAIGGVIGQPFHTINGLTKGRTIWGIPGVGFGGLVTASPPKGKRIIATTRSHSNPRVEAVLNCVQPDEVIRVGGAGYKTILLMEGRANAYVFASAGCKKWDSCAPEAVLRSIGGDMTDLSGQHYQYHKDVQFVNEGGILATAEGENHGWYVKQVSSVS